MPKVHLIAHDGKTTTLDVEAGQSVMLATVHSNTPGIYGECGGMLTCATCHVYVDTGWQSKLNPPHDDEVAMLDFTAAERKPESRLSCQIEMSAALDGLVLTLPDKQI
jgi:ferredoxin, 2Fe-2S